MPHTSSFLPSFFSLLKSFSSFHDLPKPRQRLPACLQHSVSECLRPHGPGCSFWSLQCLSCLVGIPCLSSELVSCSCEQGSTASVAAPAKPEPVPACGGAHSALARHMDCGLEDTRTFFFTYTASHSSRLKFHTHPSCYPVPRCQNLKRYPC